MRRGGGAGRGRARGPRPTVGGRVAQRRRRPLLAADARSALASATPGLRGGAAQRPGAALRRLAGLRAQPPRRRLVQRGWRPLLAAVARAALATALRCQPGDAAKRRPGPAGGRVLRRLPGGRVAQPRRRPLLAARGADALARAPGGRRRGDAERRAAAAGRPWGRKVPEGRVAGPALVAGVGGREPRARRGRRGLRGGPGGGGGHDGGPVQPPHVAPGDEGGRPAAHGPAQQLTAAGAAGRDAARRRPRRLRGPRRQVPEGRRGGVPGLLLPHLDPRQRCRRRS
mmetsp:Transcript_67286/g.208600  ORF Transcript_67286/g.208600 Transcript_67286/m.208600 type:complete len:285 (+) Transcript_67286:185-1039(+)